MRCALSWSSLDEGGRRTSRLLAAAAATAVAVLGTPAASGAAVDEPTPKFQLDHFLCYGVSQGGFDPRRVPVTDQFGSSIVEVLRRVALCNPVRKNRGEVVNRDAHLVCYAIRRQEPFQPRQVWATDQFDTGRKLGVRRHALLCVPSGKSLERREGVQVPEGLDHFGCYTTDRQPRERRRVRLVDQFGKHKTRVRRAGLLCTPTRKGDERVTNRDDHLVCYDVRTFPRGKRRAAVISNQFERDVKVRVARARRLCLPAHKDTKPPLPDLRPTVIDLASGGCPGGQGTCTTDVTYEVTNLGPIATGPFDVLASADPALATQTTISFPGGLPPGASTGPLTVTLGPADNCFDPDCTVSILADSGGAVLESEEGNNLATRTELG